MGLYKSDRIDASNVMSYKWRKEDWGCELGENERIIDWSFLAELNFTLAVLLTSKGGVLIYSNVGSSGVRLCVTHLQKFAPTVNEAAAVCVLPDASGLAFILLKGSVLLVSLRCILDVPWGRCDILANDSISIMEVNGVEEGCLCTPTSALCYTAHHSNRPYLIYANKAGQLFIIDLTMMVVSVMLRAPESIHSIALYSNKGDVHLLVSGFTSEQWILPLETDGRGLRETLGQVIPWDLREQYHKTSQISVTFDEMLAVLSTEDCTVKLFDDTDMKIAKSSISVPENTWQVHILPHMIFAVTDQISDTEVSVYSGGLFSVGNVFYEKILDFSNEKILGFVPILCENILPSCLLVTEHDVFVLSPNRSLREILVNFVAKLDYSYNICMSVAQTFRINTADLVQNVLDDTFSTIQNFMDQEIILNKLIHLALDSSMDLITLIQWCTKNNSEHALVDVVKDMCAENPNEEGRHHMINLCMAYYKAYPQEKVKIETILNEFLVQHPDVHTDMEKLLEADFWTTVAIIVDNSLDKAETVGRYLAKAEKDWPAIHSSFIVKILSSLCWKSYSKEDGEMLLRRMIEFVPYLRSVPHFTAFAKIGIEQVTSYQHNAAVLYVLSSLYLMQATCNTCLPSATDSIISNGSNFTAVVTSEEAVGYWGEFSPGTLKSKECEKSRAQGVSRLCMLDIPVRICSVSCGTEHLLCLTIHGKVYAFGRNRFGQCGVGHTDELTVATEVVGNYGSARIICAGHYHSALINEKGNAFTWGWSFHGQLGINTRCSFIDKLVPNLVKSLNGRVISVACGYAHTLFLMESGVVYSCGNGSYGQLGIGVEIKKRFEPEAVPVPDKIIMIASKYFHCLAVSEEQKIYCWGANPQALKMKMFVKRRLRVETDKTVSTIGKKNDKLAISNAHLTVTELEHMVQGKIIHIDAGYSHSALINEYKNLYTWGKSLDMQLGHGNKKEQEEPHQLFEPADVAWDFVSCGYDFTTAVTSRGTVYVWGRNYKGNLGVESGVSSSVSRKIVFKTAKGPSRTIEVGGDSCCIARPTKFPSLVAFALTEVCFDEVRKYSLIDFVKKLDSCTISNISSQLLTNPVYCLPAVYMHLLAGDLIHAIEFLTQIPSKEIEAIADNNNELEGSELFAFIDVIWDLICKHPNFAVQSKALSDLLSTFAVGDRVVKSRKLSALVPLLLISKPEILSSLDSSEILEILEKWQPDPSIHGLQISQNSVQNYSGRVRYWTCCGTVEKCPVMVRSSTINDKRRICPRCCEKWSCSVRAKFLKYGNDVSN
uniref:RCC1-like domain-containing protein n=1 Tax=Onchocerca volvulus TaxID=6282 RepID=A0A8R1TTY3_ONCVO